jgi:hypothetical protein
MDDRPTTQDDNTRLLARDEISKALIAHLSLCPLAGQDVSTRLRNLEVSYARLVGYMIGSGLISGASIFALSKTLPGIQ